MGRRNRRGLRPDLELFERRELLSAITDVLAGNGLHGAAPCCGRRGRRFQQLEFRRVRLAGELDAQSGPGPQSRRLDQQHGARPHREPEAGGELKRQQFTARFVGPYSVVPGQTTTQATQTLIQGGGTANTMLHSDIQIRLVTPKDSSLPIGGVSTIFDRNINSNTTLGLDLSAPQQDVDVAGRPDHFSTVTIDANISSGVYVEAYSQGTVNIRYIPSGKHTAGVISQGTAIVTIHAQIYTANASFILRNVGLNP